MDLDIVLHIPSFIPEKELSLSIEYSIKKLTNGIKIALSYENAILSFNDTIYSFLNGLSESVLMYCKGALIDVGVFLTQENAATLSFHLGKALLAILSERDIEISISVYFCE